MRKIINGILYDTEQANRLHTRYLDGEVEAILYETLYKNFFVLEVDVDDVSGYYFSELTAVKALQWLLETDTYDTSPAKEEVIARICLEHNLLA